MVPTNMAFEPTEQKTADATNRDDMARDDHGRVRLPANDASDNHQSTDTTATTTTATTTISATDTLRWIPPTPDDQPRLSFLIALENTTIQESAVLKGCPMTAQLSLNTTDNWTIQTYDIHGRPKTVGGDEFYISYRDPAIPHRIVAASNTTDHNDGTYTLHFTMSPLLPRRRQPNTTHTVPTLQDLIIPENGVLIIWLEYSCGIGAMDRPQRDDWSCNGASLVNWNVTDVPKPPMQVFVPPNITIDLGSFDMVLAVGDSVMQQFIGKLDKKYTYPNSQYATNPQYPLRTRFLQAYLTPTMKRLKRFQRNRFKTVLLVGTAAWDLQSPYGLVNVRSPGDLDITDEQLLSDHLKAVESLLGAVQNDFPNVPIVWKLGSALHLHEVGNGKPNDWRDIRRLDYMSQSRTFRLYRRQQELMAKLGIPVIDTYPATYLMGDRIRFPGDSIHYDIESNKMLLSLFYPKGVHKD